MCLISYIGHKTIDIENDQREHSEKSMGKRDEMKRSKSLGNKGNREKKNPFSHTDGSPLWLPGFAF